MSDFTWLFSLVLKKLKVLERRSVLFRFQLDL